MQLFGRPQSWRRSRLPVQCKAIGEPGLRSKTRLRPCQPLRRYAPVCGVTARGERQAAGIGNAGGGEEWDVLGARVYWCVSVSSTSTHTGRAELQGRRAAITPIACWLLNRARKNYTCMLGDQLHAHGIFRRRSGTKGEGRPWSTAAHGQGSGLGRDG